MSISRNPEDMTAVELLHTLAFLRQDYVPDVVARLEQAFDRKGFGDKDIRSWREQFLQIESADSYCPECDKSLFLEYEDLIEGCFVCPGCHKTQEIDYSALENRPFRPGLLDRLLDTFDGELSTESDSEISDEALFKALASSGFPIQSERMEYHKCLFVLRKFTNEDLGAWRQKQIKASVVSIAEADQHMAQTAIENTRAVDDPYTEVLGSSGAERDEINETTIDTVGTAALIEKSLPAEEITNFSDKDIIEALAMHKEDYTPEAREQLRQSLLSRGYAISDLKAWRKGAPLSTEATLLETSRFKPGGLLSKNLVLFYGILIAACFIDMPYSLGFFGAEDAKFPGPLFQIAVVIIFLASVNIPLIFLQWFYRVHKNLKYLEHESPKYHPLFTIAGFFLPVISFFCPYFVAREIVQSGLRSKDNETNYPVDKAMSILNAWWGAFLLLQLVNFWLMYSYGDSWLEKAAWLRFASDIVCVVAAYCAILLVRMIDRLQNARYQALAFTRTTAV